MVLIHQSVTARLVSLYHLPLYNIITQSYLPCAIRSHLLQFDQAVAVRYPAQNFERYVKECGPCAD